MIYRIPLKIQFTDSPSTEEIRERIRRALAREESVLRTRVDDIFKPIKLATWDESIDLAKASLQ